MESQSKLGEFIAQLVTRHTRLVFVFFLILLVSLSIGTLHFRLDASADSLLLENDPTLRSYRQATLEYGSDDFLFVVFSPKSELFQQNNMDALAQLQETFRQLPGVSSVISLLDIPIFDSASDDIFSAQDNAKTLKDKNISLSKAKRLLVQNPIYKDLIISSNGHLTALQINLKTPESLKNAVRALTEFQVAHDGILLTEPQESQLNNIKQTLRLQSQKNSLATKQLITDIRKILSQNKADAELFLGGVPMVANDLIEYVNNDLVLFGILIFLILIVILTLIFKQWHWIFLPLTMSSLAVISIVGLLGWLDWPATVISSNFIALLLIMTISLTIHLIVRFRELTLNNTDTPVPHRIKNTLGSMFWPCLFTAITTMVAFGSLIVSDIRPVKDFGLMMSMGLALAFFIVFFTFPLSVLWTYKNEKEKVSSSFLTEFTSSLGRWTLKHPLLIFIISSVIALFAITGIFQLSVDNRFIDYFRSHTDIHRGMKTIDDHLGGTTPLDIIIKTEGMFAESNAEDIDADDEFEDDFAAEFDTPSEENTLSPWFSLQGATKLAEVQQHLDSYPVTGKVLSLSTTFEFLKVLNGGQLLDDFILGLAYKRLDNETKQQLFYPYHKEDGSEVRFTIRMIDSHPELKRSAFLQSLDHYFKDTLQLKPEDYTITGMFVLYNNMLDSLFDSQIKTITTVFSLILIMFIFIFRSFYLAIIGLIPNLIAASMVLGAMGWFNIPLDMMTIMIAAIAIGIGVDNTIHYIFRFRKEFSKNNDYARCVQACHDSIGKALYYTSLTVIAGFCILVFSNFIPTIYFGLLTSIAMGTALLANLTLLPQLLLRLKPKIPGFSH